MRKLKIAVFHNLPAGGAIKALQDNIQFLRKNGHHVDVYTTDWSNFDFVPLKDEVDNYYIYPIKKSKFRVTTFKIIAKLIPSIPLDENSKTFISFKEYNTLLKKIAEDIDSKNYDLIFLEQDILFSLSSPIIKYINSLKVYYCQQPPRNNEKILQDINYPKKQVYEKVFDRIFGEDYLKLDEEYAKYSDYILCNSYFSHENILRQYGRNAQVSYLGVNTKQFYAKNLPRTNKILSVGSVYPSKGFDFIIKSLSKVDANIRPKLIIVGYSPNEEYINLLYNLANKLNVELEILSDISYEELINLYNEVKMVIFTPYLEPFGLVPLEASACGTPVIGVKEGGVKETIEHGKTGLLLDRDENIFAEGITELLTNQKLWEDMSNYGPKYINNFWTLEHGGQRLLNHFYRILDEHNEKKDEYKWKQLEWYYVEDLVKD